MQILYFVACTDFRKVFRSDLSVHAGTFVEIAISLAVSESASSSWYRNERSNPVVLFWSIVPALQKKNERHTRIFWVSRFLTNKWEIDFQRLRSPEKLTALESAFGGNACQKAPYIGFDWRLMPNIGAQLMSVLHQLWSSSRSTSLPQLYLESNILSPLLWAKVQNYANCPRRSAYHRRSSWKFPYRLLLLALV
jgi:hypothetical protein